MQSDESGSEKSDSTSEHVFFDAQSGAAQTDHVSPISNSKSHVKSSLSSQGGCMNIISKAAFGSQATCEHINLVPGRCIASIIHDEGQQFVFVNVHNFNLSSSQNNIIHDFIVERTGLAEHDPSCHAVVVCGDFNLRFEKPSIDLSTGSTIENSSRSNKQATKSCRPLAC